MACRCQMKAKDDRIVYLEDQLLKLKADQDMIMLLVCTGPVIRKRYMEQTKINILQCLKTNLNNTVLQESNIAAHRLDILADFAFIQGGFWYAEQDTKLFEKLYGLTDRMILRYSSITICTSSV